MYWLITLVPFLALAVSFKRFKSIFHPHFVFSVIIAIMFFSDFIVRGYDDDSLRYVELNDVYAYQAIVLAIFFVIYVVTYFGSQKKTIQIEELFAGYKTSKQIYIVIASFAWAILMLEIMKRLYYCQWSFELMLSESFGSRHNRPWDSSEGYIGDDKFLTSFLGIIFPLSGIIFGILVIQKNRTITLISLIGYAIVVALLVGNGSRTMVVLIVALPLILYMSRKGALVLKMPVLIGSMVGLYIVSSLMVQSRDLGFMNQSLSDKSIEYSQDDSYYRTIYAMHIADSTQERWDSLPFVGASLLNMIPRAIWAEKPTVTKEYWGSYKEYYVTITFVGESVALLGLYGGAIASILIGLALYIFLNYFYRKISNPLRLVAYGLCAMYVYMVMRSMLNITQFVYILLVFQGILWLFDRRKAIASRFRRNKLN